MDITFTDNLSLDQQEILDLYENAGWKAYTRNPAKLIQALQNSEYVLLALDRGKLVGLIRTVGDGTTITYIQDILVHSDYKRRGIGRQLMRMTLDKFANVRQKVLLTDDNPETRGFYESMGFLSCDRGELVSFAILES